MEIYKKKEVSEILDFKISIIIPIYNTKSVLSRCIESVINQSYKNLEIICVNDGSTDGSEGILIEYAKRDSRIKVLHKDNGGESSARNTGLKAMTGQYVGFVDCDDWIESDMYEKLVSKANETEADMVISTWYYDKKYSSEKVLNHLFVAENVFDRDRLLYYIYRRDDYRGFAYIWNKLYNRKLFYDNEGKLMLFDEDLALGGDVLYLGKLAFHTKSAYYFDEAFYHYDQRETSGCHTEDLSKREDWLEAYRRLILFFERGGVKADIIKWIKRFMAYHSSNIAQMAYEQRNQEVLVRCQNIMDQLKNEYTITNRQYPDRIERYNKILRLK